MSLRLSVSHACQQPLPRAPSRTYGLDLANGVAPIACLNQLTFRLTVSLNHASNKRMKAPLFEQPEYKWFSLMHLADTGVCVTASCQLPSSTVLYNSDNSTARVTQQIGHHQYPRQLSQSRAVFRAMWLEQI